MRAWHTFVVVAVGLAGVAGSPSRAAAWGKDGHELVGKIADQHLTAQGRRGVDELLQGHQFRSLADGRLTNWADTIKSSAVFRRKFPTMSQWHFIDIDVRKPGNPDEFDLSAFCQGGDCAVGALERFRAVLKNPAAGLQDRREALFFIAHFVGDIHQPLHCAERDNDRGGNLQRVHLTPGDPHVVNLHRVWDTELVEDAVGPLTLEDYATRLTNTLTRERRKAFQKGGVKEWVIDSHKIAREKVYKDQGADLPPANGPIHTLSADYLTDRAEVVEEQLLKGGVRLAQFLNDVFKE